MSLKTPKRAVKRPTKFKDGELGTDVNVISRDVPYATIMFDDGVTKDITKFDGDIMSVEDNILSLEDLSLGMEVVGKWENVFYPAKVTKLYNGFATDSVLTMDVPGTMPTASGRTEQSSSAARPCDDVSVKSPSDKQLCDITAILVLADGRVLMLDYNNKAVKLLSGDGRLLSELSLPSAPWGMALVRGDEAMVTMPGKKKLVIISITDRLTRRRTIKTDVECMDIAVSGDKLITGSRYTGEIVMRDMDGRRIRTIRTSARGYTYCVNINPDNDRRYVTDRNTVTCVTLAGDVLGQYRDGNLEGPRGMAIHPDGTVYVCGRWSNNVHHITADCTAISIILGNGEVERPQAVGIGSRAGKLYVSESVNNKLKVFKLMD